MPFEETQVGGQHSQEMTIVSVQDDYLKCTMQSINHFGEAPVYKFYRIGPDASAGTKTVDVSRPSELSKSTVVANGNEWVNVNSYSGGSGEYKLEIPYEAGQKIMVTKGIEIPLTSSSNSGISGLETNSTVDIFVDENREGRSWAQPGIEGFSEKCIVICENGEEIKGTILWKDGCDGDTDDGGGGSTTTQQYCIECSSPGLTYDDPNEGPVGETRKWYVKTSYKAADSPSAAKAACQLQATEEGITGTGGDVDAVDVDSAFCDQQTITPATAAPAAAPQNLQINVSEQENPENE